MRVRGNSPPLPKNLTREQRRALDQWCAGVDMNDWTNNAPQELELPVLEFEKPADAAFKSGPVYVMRIQLPESWDANGSPVEAA